jgi:hypothetical protein
MTGPRQKKAVAQKVSSKVMFKRAKRIAGRLKRAPDTAKLSADDASGIARADGKAGKGRVVPSNAFTRAEPSQAMADVLRPVKKPPKWIYAMIERGASQEDVLERAYQRLKRMPTRANHLLVQGLLQEFARAPRARVKIGKLVTKQRLSEFIKKEG